jgi:hypothetical protein
VLNTVKLDQVCLFRRPPQTSNKFTLEKPVAFFFYKRDVLRDMEMVTCDIFRPNKYREAVYFY